MKWIRTLLAAPHLLRAAQLLEYAEHFNANVCPDADDHADQAPEACPHCFPYFDDARIARRVAIGKATGLPE